jgi:hypothetical protein
LSVITRLIPASVLISIDFVVVHCQIQPIRIDQLRFCNATSSIYSGNTESNGNISSIRKGIVQLEISGIVLFGGNHIPLPIIVHDRFVPLRIIVHDRFVPLRIIVHDRFDQVLEDTNSEWM